MADNYNERRHLVGLWRMLTLDSIQQSSMFCCCLSTALSTKGMEYMVCSQRVSEAYVT